jgi:hypothetical protein
MQLPWYIPIRYIPEVSYATYSRRSPRDIRTVQIKPLVHPWKLLSIALLALASTAANAVDCGPYKVAGLMGDRQKEDQVRAMDSGFDRHFINPTDLRVLVDSIAQWPLSWAFR